MAPRFGQVRAQRLMSWVLAAMAVLLLSPGAHALRPLPSATSARASVAATPWAPTGELRTALEARLEAIAEWTMTLNLRSDNVTGTEESDTTSIFMNGNLARVLLAQYSLAGGAGGGNKSRVDEALAWCDTFVTEQNETDSSMGHLGGYWGTGYDQVYIADTGTAVTTLALCAGQLVPGSSRYTQMHNALVRFHVFVAEGCKTPPPQGHADNCPPSGTGWILEDGSLGDGYYQNAINLTPYTIATATTGGVFYTELDVLQPRSEYAATAANAVEWLLRSVEPNGTIPYILTPQLAQHYVYQATSYSTEAFVDAWLRRPLQRPRLEDALAPTIRWLVATQNADGMWGNVSTPLNGENLRSPRAASLLQWWIGVHPDDAAATAALQRFAKGVADDATATRLGVGSHNLVTGFVGLALADMLAPWSTFLPVK